MSIVSQIENAIRGRVVQPIKNATNRVADSVRNQFSIGGTGLVGNSIDYLQNRVNNGNLFPTINGPSQQFSQQHPVLGFLGNIGSGFVNTPSNVGNFTSNFTGDAINIQNNNAPYTALHNPLTKLGYQIGNQISPGRFQATPQNAGEYIGNLVDVGSFGLNFLGGGAAENALKDSLLSTGIKGIAGQIGKSSVTGAGLGSVGGLFSGLSANRDQSLTNQFVNSLPSVGQGLLMGGFAGGVTGALPHVAEGVLNVADNIKHGANLDQAARVLYKQVSETTNRGVNGKFSGIQDAGGYTRTYTESTFNDALRSSEGIKKVIDPMANLSSEPKVTVTFDRKGNMTSVVPERPEFAKYIEDAATTLSPKGAPSGTESIYANKRASSNPPLSEAQLKKSLVPGNAKFRTQSTGEVENRFVTRAKISPDTSAEAKAMFKGTHTLRSTALLEQQAKDLITSDPARAQSLAMNGGSDLSAATAINLIKKYAAEGDFQAEADLVNAHAKNALAAGREVQANVLLKSMSPEGRVAFAAREINAYNDAHPKNPIPGLTPEQVSQLHELARQADTLPEGRDRNLLFQKLNEQIADLVPTPFWKKVTTIWKAGLLTGLKTSGTNLLSTASQAVAEASKNPIAVGVDSVASLFTGQRTKTLPGKGYFGGFKEGFEKGFDYLKSGYDENNAGARLEYNRISFGKGPVARALQSYEESVFRLLGAEDQPFFYGAKALSLRDQAGAAAKNQGLSGSKARAFMDDFVANPPDEAVKIAVQDASVATFRNDTQLGKLAKAIQQTGGPLGELIIPFGKTPAAAATSLVNYTPVGIAKTIIENIGKGKFDQRAFSEGIGRGLTGTAVLAVGAALSRAGLITGAAPTNQDERDLWELQGKKANSIFVGGKWRSIQPLGTAGLALVVGKTYQDALEKSGSPTQAAVAASGSMAKVVTDQSFLKGLSGALNAVNDPTRYANSLFENTVGSVVPTQVSDIAQATDPLQRQVNGPIEAVKNRIPGLRQQLAPKIDAFGQELPRATNGVQTYLDPFRPSDFRNNLTAESIAALQAKGKNAAPNKIGKTITQFGVKISLPVDIQNELQIKAGHQIEDAYRKAFSDPQFRLASSSQQENYLNTLVSNIHDQVERKYMSTLGAQKLAELGATSTKDPGIPVTPGSLPSLTSAKAGFSTSSIGKGRVIKRAGRRGGGRVPRLKTPKVTKAKTITIKHASTKLPKPKLGRRTRYTTRTRSLV